MPTSDDRIAISIGGEVSERTELLNGALQVALDRQANGGADGEARTWRCSSSFTWKIGRSDEVPLLEGDLAIEDASEDGEFEVFAVLEQGTAVVDPDTGAAAVRATLIVDGARGDLVCAGDTIACELRIDSETWEGEIRLPAAAAEPGAP
jgi:hypothetical protein